MFESYRSAHHPDADRRLRLATGYLNGEVDDAAARRVLARRDRVLWFEMESSALAGILIAPFAAACPDKLFILTMRDVYSWCDSWIDHNINSPPAETSLWTTLDRTRLRVGDFPATRFDAPLTERGFPPLPSFFQLWSSHSQRVLDTVPYERLLIVRTHEIVAGIPGIAAFVRVPEETLLRERAWLHVSTRKHGLLAQLDSAYVRETAERFCAPLMTRFFPEAAFQYGEARM